MNRWIKIVIGLSLLSVFALTAAWRHYVQAPLRTQAKFETLMDDVAPVLKRRKAERRVKIATSISAMFNTPQPNETAEKREERLAAKAKLDTSIQKSEAESLDSEFEAYKTTLQNFDARFAQLNSAHLSPCQNEDLYRNWGALKLWTAWSKQRTSYADGPKDPIQAYEASYTEYTGRPVSFEEVKAVGEAEYEAVQSELSALEKKVQAEYNQSLDDLAMREENFSSTENEILARINVILANVETKFTDLEDFDFAPVPKATVQTREGFGPRYAIASYVKNDNAMRLYWAFGRYNHIYDTMLVVHEIMPGHHLQMGMETRRVCGKGPISAHTPMIEGWATYAEFLADERGLFDAADQKLGWLDYRLVRAMRIIMDTARIEQNITEAEAWKLWQDKMPRRLNDDFPREWARINASPHHLSYIFGSQAIMNARQKLRLKMGAGFDETAFHEALLNAHHQSLLFLPERIDAQMRARQLLDTPLTHAAETTL